MLGMLFSILVWLKLNFMVANTIQKIMAAEAKAWTKKYFSEASVVIKFLALFIIGMKANKLISNPIQAPNHVVEDTVIRVPKNRVKINKGLETFLIIKKKRIGPL